MIWLTNDSKENRLILAWASVLNAPGYVLILISNFLYPGAMSAIYGEDLLY